MGLLLPLTIMPRYGGAGRAGLLENIPVSSSTRSPRGPGFSQELGDSSGLPAHRPATRTGPGIHKDLCLV